MPRVDKTLIRDYYLNGRDETQTIIYAEYNSDTQMGHVRREYSLKNRPELQIHIEDFQFC